MSIAAIKPWSVQVELVAGCQLRCPFCGINALPWKQGEVHSSLSVEQSVHVASEIRTLNDKPRIEFALRGEPLLNPKAVAIIQVFRRVLPQAQLQMTSNGVVLLKENVIPRLFQAGLNILLLDCYRGHGEKLRAVVERNHGRVPVYELGDGPSPWHNHGPRGAFIVLSPDLRDIDTASRTIFNQAGNSPVGRTEKPLGTMCPSPWREVVIHSDGNVPLCCDDWGGEYVLGNVFETPLAEIWVGEAAQAARRLLRYGQRWFTPCCRCDGPSPGRNKAIPHCRKAGKREHDIVRRVNNGSPAFNGKEPEWWGPE
jgi:2-deoxy-scyllo-inosamine dehydrogenase (SAM-dependent)